MSMLFMQWVVTRETSRYEPGIQALVDISPKMLLRDRKIPFACSMDYTASPPRFEVFPATELLDDMRYINMGLAGCCVRVPDMVDLRRKVYEEACNSDGKLYANEIIFCGKGGEDLVLFGNALCHSPCTVIGNCIKESASTNYNGNPRRRRARDRNGTDLRVRVDVIDVIMEMAAQNVRDQTENVVVSGEDGDETKDEVGAGTVYEEVLNVTQKYFAQ